MKTKEEIEEKASEYVDSVRNRIDSYAYLDVQEAFKKGAEWMQEQVNDVPTSQEQALNLACVNLRFSLDDLKTLSDKLWDVQDEGPLGEGWKSDELEKLLAMIDNAIENAG